MDDSRTGLTKKNAAAKKSSNRFIFYVTFILVTFILLQVLTIMDKGRGLMHSSWKAVQSANFINLQGFSRVSSPDPSVHEHLRRSVAACIPPEVLTGKFDQQVALTSSQAICLKEVLSAASLELDSPALSHDSADQPHSQHQDEELDKVNQELDLLKEQLRAAGDYLRQSVQMHPLKDLREAGMTHGKTTWFMSLLQRGPVEGKQEEFRFPADDPQGRILCLQGNHSSNGTMNSYGFAWRGYLPSDAKLLPGLTFVVDNYWDYGNPWHSMSALLAFVAWRAENDCKSPERIVTYHWGEVRTEMGDWIRNILHASLGVFLNPEGLRSYEQGPVCFEDAVVHRRGLGGVSKPRMNKLFDMVRCKVHKFCKVIPRSYFLDNKEGKIDITLLARTGAREFSDLTGVVSVVSEQCKLVQGCDVRVVAISNLSFCEQVEVMSRTDVLITSHGAQLTNMMFMPKFGSVMELFPRGWLEFAGVGQYIYTWLADWTGLEHEGTWRDPEGPDCPFPTTETLKCFLFYKDRRVGLNATHLSAWTNQVLGRVQSRRQNGTEMMKVLQTDCGCENI